MHIKRFLFTALVLFTLVGLASAEQVCTESEYKGRTIKKCRDTGSSGGDSSMDSFTDPRDGQTYRTVQIGSQTWMAENLNYRTDDSYCYDDESANCRKYGRLYTWNAALNACPSGWHLPSKAEFETLLKRTGEFVEEEYEIEIYSSGRSLKSTSGWNDYKGKNGNGTDSYGFSALPAGGRGDVGDFGGVGYNAGFWSATECYSNGAYHMGLGYDDDSADLGYHFKDIGLSVRCLRNSRL
ncbi:MAG: fibrobacter succinogenes major paralogous domain-containing protein [Hallerella succinigenes]|uniref:fibrobacter succinogenes major paralogous domain-containing protein n=1 Tax=Hallerella succinigenes TaxID=1896222 RepID=UPI0023EFDB06|nr:fibrobacter succinogenes major paralogous domain-containing protein [Hallerella succinigenes]MDD6092260.1 fibrobacter succinogenes major paralogous domain-containing protein [Hallerella succinigenes]